MITIGYSTRKPNPEFSYYLESTFKGIKGVQIIEKVNDGEMSLSVAYNQILSESNNDIVVLCHDDIYFDSTGWVNKIVKHFEKNPEYGILGVAGSTNIPTSGMWWENRSKMIGIVNHEHEGKKWESKYCNSLGNDIKETIIVDGLFIALHKERIKHTFDESVDGFHFYDVNFGFKNYLDGVKVGVVFNIRITHKSIGMTNNKWEENRQIFAEKYKSVLPQKIKVNPTDKLKILIACLFFKEFTGSEMYVYELAKNLVKDGHDVSILASQINGPLTTLGKQSGIKIYDFNNPPGYKMGDGKWGINTPEGFVISKPNSLYKLSEIYFDIIHTQHTPITQSIINFYPNIKKISTIHSEVISLENPIIHESIIKYIAIRPEIKEHLINEFKINEDNIEVIYNPIDENKFKSKNIKSENSVLFVGTIDYIRKNTIYDLIEYTKENNKELWLVGDNKSNYISEILLNKHVKYYKSTPNVETYIHRCSETAGILLGRTTIEGWMCGKPGWIYNVDSTGFIHDKEFKEVPSDLDKFKSSTVINEIKKIYYNLVNL
jgi:glycosyltransferase involved in cell wall biosynthesis